MTSKCMDFEVLVELLTVLLKDVPGGFPKSDLLGVTVALIHVAAQRGNWPYGCEIRV